MSEADDGGDDQDMPGDGAPSDDYHHARAQWRSPDGIFSACTIAGFADNVGVLVACLVADS